MSKTNQNRAKRIIDGIRSVKGRNKPEKRNVQNKQLNQILKES